MFIDFESLVHAGIDLSDTLQAINFGDLLERIKRRTRRAPSLGSQGSHRLL